MQLSGREQTSCGRSSGKVIKTPYSSCTMTCTFTWYATGLSVHADSDLVKDCISQLFLKLWDRYHRLKK